MRAQRGRQCNVRRVKGRHGVLKQLQQRTIDTIFCYNITKKVMHLVITFFSVGLVCAAHIAAFRDMDADLVTVAQILRHLNDQTGAHGSGLGTGAG